MGKAHVVPAGGGERPFVVGEYTGNDTLVPTSSNSQTVQLGFTPSLVLVYQSQMQNYGGYLGVDKIVLAAPDMPIGPWSESRKIYSLRVVDGGFEAGSPRLEGTIMGPSLNDNGRKYRYVAFR